MNTMEAVIQYFIEKWPIFTIAILAVIGIVWLAVWITKRAVKADLLEEKCKNMPCEAHTSEIEGLGSRMDKLEGRMDKLEDLSQNINKNVIAIQTFLQTKYPTAAQVFSQKFSPRQLNKKGREMFDKFGGKEFLDANEDLLMECVAAKMPKTALDVEQDALEALYETLDSDIFNGIKLKVYNSKDIEIEVEGKKERYSLTMNDICFIFSIDLRDRYLNKHPEVPQADN
ncbi:MAG: hypothetical protein MJZ77_00185 [Bacteroidales bacterium]|nr:hypothetical protein [Bacteroidales bacterium]